MNDNRWWLGVGLVGVGAVAAVVWWLGAQTGEGGGASRADTAGAGAVPGAGVPSVSTDEGGPGGQTEIGPVAGERARRPAPLAAGRAGEAGPAAAASMMTEAEVWSHYEPTRDELVYRAQVVEQQAERELRRLVRVLDLSEERQDRIFAALVRSSEWYHPSLQAEGVSGRPIRPAREEKLGAESSGGRSAGELTPAEAAGSVAAVSPGTPAASPLVLAELTPEEAGVYERYASERAAFWAGVVEDAERQLQSAP